MCDRMDIGSGITPACMPSMSFSDWCMLWAMQSRKGGARSNLSECWLVEGNG